MKLTTYIYSSVIGAMGLLAGFTVSADPLTSAINEKTRSEQNIQRDQYRHPKQTLTFFEIKPDQTVVEIWPGGGWYSEILAPYLKAKGQYYAAHFPQDSQVKYFQNSLAKFKQKIADDAAYKNVKLTEFNPQTHHKIAPENSADLVLTFRNLHNWYIRGEDKAAIESFKAFYQALKPGGVLGVVDHQMPENFDQIANKKSGYVKMSKAISWALQAGFILESSSEINANNQDSAIHPKGVWTLPPSLRLGDKNKADYLAIGESDRFTLKFRKPK